MPGHYNIDGEIYPSVTTVLQKMLPEPYGISIWKLRNPNWREELKYKATMGSIIHYRILSRLSPRILDLPGISFDDVPVGEDIDTIFEIADVIWDKIDLDVGNPRTIETIHVNKKEKYCGTPDLKSPIRLPGEDEHILTLADIKTSKEIHDTHIMQMGGYYPMLDPKPDRAILISVHPYTKGNPKLEGHIKIISKEELEQKAKEFTELVRRYHRIHSIQKKGKVTKILARPNSDEEILEVEDNKE